MNIAAEVIFWGSLEITTEQIAEVKRAGMLVHIEVRYYPNEEIEARVFAATRRFVENYHNSGGLWEYAD